MSSGRAAIVTGANGFIGSHLLPVLLRRGWAVSALGRSKGGAPWRDRVFAALQDAGPIQLADANQLRCYESDLARPDLGFEKGPGFLGQSKAVLFHLAGDTRFHPVDKLTQRCVNVDGACHVIRALHPVLSLAVHVSTAFVAGDRTGVVLENEAAVGQGFHNHYEETKHEAELCVEALCLELRLPRVVIRPGIIVNDTVLGRSSSFTHLNVMVEVVNRIQEFYGIDDGETVNPEIKVSINPSARPNMAAVDPVVEALAMIAEAPSASGTFHLCHPAPQSNAEVFQLVMEAFGVGRKIRINFVRRMPKPPTRTEEMIVRVFKSYLPYLNEDRLFDLSNTRTVIPEYDKMFGQINVDYLRKVIEFERSRRKH